MVKDLGTYPEKAEFLHAPYAAQFRLVGTRFRVNLVLCEVEAVKDPKTRIDRLAQVHRYFENLTGNQGITLLLAEGLHDMPMQAAGASPPTEMVPLRASLPAGKSLDDRGQRVFVSSALRLMIETSGFGASNPPVTYVTLGAAR